MTVLSAGEPTSVIGLNQVLDSLPLDVTTHPTGHFEAHDFYIKKPESYDAEVEIEIPTKFWQPHGTITSASFSDYRNWNSVASVIFLTNSVDLQGCFITDLTARQEHTRKIHNDYQHRIEILNSDTEVDDFALNEASKKDFWQYIRSVPFAQKAGLVLVDNGNLRAVWKGDDESHLGIQFLGNQWVEYVIFKRRPSTRHVARVAGHDTLDGVKRLIDAFDLTSLMGT